jgi:hypothetical protein
MIATTFTFLACSAAFAQDTQTPNEGRRVSYGVELAFRSGHADRGFIISDRPVIQPVMWLSARRTDLSVWSSFTLAETTDGSRPSILEIELTHAYKGGRVTVEPALRAFFYRDPLSPFSTRSIEGWLYLSYNAGPFRFFTNHSLDVQTYKGAYSVDAGIEADGHLSPRVKAGASFSAGWGSASFNDAWVGVANAALDRVSAEGWVAAYVNPRLYIGPRVDFSTILDRRVRTAAWRPSYVLVGLTVGGEF